MKYCAACVDKNVRGYPSKDICTATIGAIAELQVATSLMKGGFHVFRPLSPAAFCDLIAVRDGILRKIEVRTGYFYGATLNYPKHFRAGASEFAVFIHESNQIIYIPISSEANKS